MDTPTSTPPAPAAPYTPAQPSASPAPMPKPTGMKKGVIAGIVVVGVLAVGYLAYAYFTGSWPFTLVEPIASKSPSPSATPDPTAWETYRNEKYGVQFRYPPDWVVSEDGGPISVFGGTPSDNIQAGVASQVWMSIVKGICNEPTNDFVLNGGPQRDELNTFEKEICSNGFQITLGLYANNPDIAGAKQILEEVAGTVRSALETSTWKTYSNAQYGFEFQYPPTWIVQDLDITQGGIVANPPDFQMPTSGTVHYSFSISVTAHGYSGDEQPVTRTFGTRTGYVYPRARSVYFPDSQSAGGYIIQLDGPAGSTEPDQILATFKFTK